MVPTRIESVLPTSTSTWYRLAKTHRMPCCGSFFAKEPLIIGLFCGKWLYKDKASCDSSPPCIMGEWYSLSFSLSLSVCPFPTNWDSKWYRNENRNPRRSKLRSLFKWTFWKETCVDHRGFRFRFRRQLRVSSFRERVVHVVETDVCTWFHGYRHVVKTDARIHLVKSCTNAHTCPVLVSRVSTTRVCTYDILDAYMWWQQTCSDNRHTNPFTTCIHSWCHAYIHAVKTDAQIHPVKSCTNAHTCPVLVSRVSSTQVCTHDKT